MLAQQAVSRREGGFILIKISQEELKALILESNGNDMLIYYHKKDGDVRRILCKLGLKKGGVTTSVNIYDINRLGYRTLSFASIRCFSMCSRNYIVD